MVLFLLREVLMEEIVFQVIKKLYRGKFLLVQLQGLDSQSKCIVHPMGLVYLKSGIGLKGFSLICSDFGVGTEYFDESFDVFCWGFVPIGGGWLWFVVLERSIGIDVADGGALN